MNILVTGAKGFVVKNLEANLNNIKNKKNRTRNITITEVLEYDINTEPSLLKEFCQKADFVFSPSKYIETFLEYRKWSVLIHILCALGKKW